VGTVVDGLAPVSGDRVSNVRIATVDVLLAQSTEFLVVPDCITAADGAVVCRGEALDGAELRSASPADDPDAHEVLVGEELVYSGSIAEVLRDAADGVREMGR
jgi:hypothetical protein